MPIFNAKEIAVQLFQEFLSNDVDISSSVIHFIKEELLASSVEMHECLEYKSGMFRIQIRNVLNTNQECLEYKSVIFRIQIRNHYWWSNLSSETDKVFFWCYIPKNYNIVIL